MSDIPRSSQKTYSRDRSPLIMKRPIFGTLEKCVTIESGLVFIFDQGSDFELDVKDIQNSFQKINISQIIRHKNMNNEKIIHTLNEVITADPKSFDGLITIIMAHSKKHGEFICTDQSDILYERDLLKIYSSESLALKPKLLIIQAECPPMIPKKNFDASPVAIDIYSLPAEADIVILQNYFEAKTENIQEQKRRKIKKERNPFINLFCSNIDRLNGKTNLIQIITETFCNVKDIKKSACEPFPRVLSTLTKDVFLQTTSSELNTTIPNEKKLYETKQKKGILYIVSYDKVAGIDEERYGNKEDVERLTKCFGFLGFDVVNKPNMRYIDLMNFLSSEDLIPSGYSCVAVAILTHGSKGQLKTTSSEIHERDIINFFTSSERKSLKDIPKIIFIQACRGKQISSVTSLTGEIKGKQNEISGTQENMELDDATPTSEDPVATSEIKLEEDFLVFHSCFDDTLSLRKCCGSTFIQELCNVIEDSPDGENVFLMDLITRTIREVGLNEDYYKGKMFKQMPVVTSTLTKMLQLGPVRKN